METQSLTRQQVIQQVIKSPHGALAQYRGPMEAALGEHEDFCAPLIAWNHLHGTIRDAKVALPLITLTGRVPISDEAYRENALAHLALLSPRDLLRGLIAWKDLGGNGSPMARSTGLRTFVEAYIRVREQDHRFWERTALQFREALTRLYKMAYVKPSPYAQAILFEKAYPEDSIFATVKALRALPVDEIGAVVLQKKLPFLTVKGALGDRIKEPALLAAVLRSMTPVEVVTNAKMLKRLGVTGMSEARGVFEEKLTEATTRNRGALLKTTKAAEVVGDTALTAQLQGVQERQLASIDGIEADVLIIGDKSGSMSSCIAYTQHFAAFVAKVVRGAVHVVFVDSAPQGFDATGLTYEQLLEATKRIDARGTTSLGSGLRYAMEHQWDVGMIAVVTDGEENEPPMFAEMYRQYCARLGREVPVYVFRIGQEHHELRRNLKQARIEYQEFAIDGSDYYSIPMLLPALRVNRYSLVDAIYATPLKTLADVFGTKGARHAVAESVTPV